MKADRRDKFEVGLNYGTHDTDHTDVIFIEEHDELGEKTNKCIMSLTVEEAEWVAVKLIQYVDACKVTR